MVRKFFFLLAVVVLMANNCQIADAQHAKSKIVKNPADELALVVMGEGFSKEDAVKSALRSAIEQCYGVFVSSNTTILNDKLVKDEIVTVSSGNIRHYDVVSELENSGKWFVTVKALVSIGNLINYVKSKGGEAEIAGSLIVQNLELQEIAAENEFKALEHLSLQLEEMKKNIFNYELKVEEISGNNYFEIPITIRVMVNRNIDACYNFLIKTLEAISLPSPSKENKYATSMVIKEPQKKLFAGLKYKQFHFRRDYGHYTNRSILSRMVTISGGGWWNFDLSDGINTYCGHSIRQKYFSNIQYYLMNFKIEDRYHESNNYEYAVGSGNILKSANDVDRYVGKSAQTISRVWLPLELKPIGHVSYGEGKLFVTIRVPLEYSRDELRKISKFKVYPCTHSGLTR